MQGLWLGVVFHQGSVTLTVALYQGSVTLAVELYLVSGSGFRVQGSGFRVQGSGFRVQGVGFMAGRGVILRGVAVPRVVVPGRFSGWGLGARG